MTAPLRKDEASPAQDLLVSQAHAEAPVIAEYADYHAVGSRKAPDRGLRNCILLANAAAWIAIIVLIRFMFF